MKKIVIVLFLIFVFLYPIPYTLYPVYADVKIREEFGFGYLQSLGEGTTKLVEPVFAVTAAIVVIFFLLGAFRWLRAGGNKEEVAAARQMIQHSIIGFVLLMFAFLILQFLLFSLFKTTDFQIIQP